MRERFSNDVFFAASRGRPRAPTVPEVAFYAGRPRPPAEAGLMERASATPARFAFLLFALGWGGILFQAGFFQQVVFGAPVFEELAKLGLALVVGFLLRTRSLWILLPLAWASGAAFGVMEHHLTYVQEDIASYAGRVAFHSGATGLSMLFFDAFHRFPDVRARWAATLPATLFHWANNFAALVFGFGSLFIPSLTLVAEGWSFGITFTVWASTWVALGLIGRFRSLAQATLERVIPRVALMVARTRPDPGP